MMDGKRELRNTRKTQKVKERGIRRRQTQKKIIRQDLQDCAGSLFLPESADEKHVNPVNPV
jgi:hypothetical protein